MTRIATRAAMALLVASSMTTMAEAQSFVYVVGKRLSPSQGGTNGQQTVSVINPATNAIVTTIPAGQDCLCAAPDGATAAPDGSRVYVTNGLEHSLTVIDTASNSVMTTIPLGDSPLAVAASPDGSRVYVVNAYGVTSVSVINTASNAVIATIPLCSTFGFGHRYPARRSARVRVGLL